MKRPSRGNLKRNLISGYFTRPARLSLKTLKKRLSGTEWQRTRNALRRSVTWDFVTKRAGEFLRICARPSVGFAGPRARATRPPSTTWVSITQHSRRLKRPRRREKLLRRPLRRLLPNLSRNQLHQARQRPSD